MSKLAQNHEDKIVNDFKKELSSYQKKLVNEFLKANDIITILFKEDEEKTNLVDGLKKIGIIFSEGLKGLKEYNKSKEESKEKKQEAKEYKLGFDNIVEEFIKEIKDLFEKFDNSTIEYLCNSDYFKSKKKLGNSKVTDLRI